MLLQDVGTNSTMVVILNEESPVNCSVPYNKLISDLGYFFHPVDPIKWTKRPPNYIAFFVKGKLLSIHHIDSYEVFNNPNDVIAEIEPQMWETHFLYLLDKPINPQANISIEGVSDEVAWCMIDTLLTCESLKEAIEKTIARENSAKYED